MYGRLLPNSIRETINLKRHFHFVISCLVIVTHPYLRKTQFSHHRAVERVFGDRMSFLTDLLGLGNRRWIQVHFQRQLNCRLRTKYDQIWQYDLFSYFTLRSQDNREIFISYDLYCSWTEPFSVSIMTRFMTQISCLVIITGLDQQAIEQRSYFV